MDWSAFHFLRPVWLIAVVPACWIWWRLRQKQHPLGQWGKVIESRFLRYFQSESSVPQRWPVNGLLALWVLTAFVLAGPSWVQQPVPAHKSREGTVIVLDLSLSMLAQDLQPGRYKRAIFTLTDLVKAHPELKFGLVAYAGSAHVITPIAEDNETLLNLLPALSPLIMPQQGSRPDLAMEKAHQLLAGARVEKGHIIWVTDDLDQAERLNAFFVHHRYTLSILAVGTEQGARIPTSNGFLLDKSGQAIIAKLPWDRLKQFAQLHRATLTPVRLDHQDLAYLLPPFSVQGGEETDQVVMQWLDFGVYLLPLIALLAVFLFRRGWVWLWLLCWLPAMPQPVWAQAQEQEKALSDWRDIFRTPDQQAYRLWQQKQFDRACDRFQRADWKGVACYRAGHYQAAERAFRQDKTARGYYNLGNALAKQHRYEAAIKAYQQALTQEPALIVARENLNLLKQLQRTRQPEAAEPETTPSKPAVPQEVSLSEPPVLTTKAVKKPQKQPEKPAEQTENKTALQKNAAPKKGGDPSSADHAEADRTQKVAQGMLGKAVSGKSEQTGVAALQKGKVQRQVNGLDQWLQLIPDQPAFYLQRKFEYQLQQQPKQREQKTW